MPFAHPFTVLPTVDVSCFEKESEANLEFLQHTSIAFWAAYSAYLSSWGYVLYEMCKTSYITSKPLSLSSPKFTHPYALISYSCLEPLDDDLPQVISYSILLCAAYDIF